MLGEVIIKETRGYCINLDNAKNIFNVKLKTETKYNENGYDEFLLYFQNTWEYIKTHNLRYHLLVDLGGSKENVNVNENENENENELPLVAYMKLITTMTKINSLLNLHCHSVCIVSPGSEKWKNAYTLGTKLWKPDKQRPLKFTDVANDAVLFFNSHKLPEIEGTWIECADGGFIRG